VLLPVRRAAGHVRQTDVFRHGRRVAPNRDDCTEPRSLTAEFLLPPRDWSGPGRARRAQHTRAAADAGETRHAAELV